MSMFPPISKEEELQDRLDVAVQLGHKYLDKFKQATTQLEEAIKQRDEEREVKGELLKALKIVRSDNTCDCGGPKIGKIVSRCAYCITIDAIKEAEATHE